jgi:glycosyltransferase involved in cell wall biosynthesis
MVKISIIIPVYNSDQHLKRCLETVCKQTFQDIEIICINDCSTDDSLLILQEYAKNNNRIKLIDLKENNGAAAARNIGIKNACGQYLGFVDSDDFIDPNFYEKLYERAEKTASDVVKGNILIYCLKTKLARSEDWIDINSKIKKHKANFCCAFTSAIYKTSFIKENNVEFPEGLVHFEDPYFVIKAALFYQNVEVVDDIYYYYVSNPNSTSRKNFSIKHVESLISSICQILDILDKYCLDKTHYLMVFDFLLEQILFYCSEIYLSDEMNIRAIDGLFIMYNRCKYKEECAIRYFLQAKKKKKEDIFKQLRNRMKNDLRNS